MRRAELFPCAELGHRGSVCEGSSEALTGCVPDWVRGLQANAPISVLHEVAADLGTTVEALCSHRRTRWLCRVRDSAMLSLRERCGLSYPELGKLFGGRDHATALAAVRRARKRGES